MIDSLLLQVTDIIGVTTNRNQKRIVNACIELKVGKMSKTVNGNILEPERWNSWVENLAHQKQECSKKTSGVAP